MLKVVIIGYGEMFTNLIAAALDANCNIVGVFRKDSTKYNSVIKWCKDIINPSIEYSYIKSYNLPEINATSVNSPEFKKKLLKLNPDIILVGSWGERFKKEVYEIPKIATINAHPSLLPKYRGPNPYFWVLKNQEQTTGITFHLMDKDYDSGAILAQEEIKIYSSDTAQSLKQRTVLAARGIACELLKTLKEDIIIPLKQKEENATYYSHPEDFELNFKKTSNEISALIRASYPWYETFFFHNTTPLTPNPSCIEILNNTTPYKEPGTITAIDINTNSLSILCGDNQIIKLSKINLYKKYDRPFIKNYMKSEIRVNDIID